MNCILIIIHSDAVYQYLYKSLFYYDIYIYEHIFMYKYSYILYIYMYYINIYSAIHKSKGNTWNYIVYIAWISYSLM